MVPSKKENVFFVKTVMKWYGTSKRDLPWRDTKDPYLIWLSEIILQQTRVDQGLPYFFEFAKQFPNIKSLAKADENKVMKLWQGLGYYSRARNMHATAKLITENYKGKFPADYYELLKMRGIGEYTAAAIASFAFDLPHAVVDGNVYRILSRYFGIKDPIDSSIGKKLFSQFASKLIDKKNPGTYNQSVMEFGAIQCKPINPDCNACPLIATCIAFSKNQVAQFPVKSKKNSVKSRHFIYLVINYKSFVYLNQRTKNDIWKGLFDFPIIESNEAIPENGVFSHPEFKAILEDSIFHIHSFSNTYKHLLSHQKLHARFLEIEIYSTLKNKNFIKTNWKKLEKFAFPRLIERYILER